MMAKNATKKFGKKKTINTLIQKGQRIPAQET